MLTFFTPKKVLFTIALAGLAYAGWSYYQPSGQGRGGRGPVPVITADVMETSWSDQIESLGTLKANEQVQLTSSAAGKVEEINFTDGQQAQKGSVLVRLESREEKAELIAAKALADETKRQYLRSKELRQRAATSQSVLDADRRAYETAKAQVGVAEARVEDRTVRAPFTGRIGLRQISPGDFIQSGDVLATLTDNKPVRLDFSVPALFIAQLKKGLAVEATTRAYPEKTFSGKISAIESYVNTSTRAVGARAILPNEKGHLSAGMLMNVQVEETTRPAIVIPEAAIVQESNASYVYVVNSDNEPAVAQKTEVKLGQRRPGDVEILKGLKEGDKVVIHGVLKLADGRPIKILAEKSSDQKVSDILEQTRPSAQKRQEGKQQNKKDQ